MYPDTLATRYRHGLGSARKMPACVSEVARCAQDLALRVASDSLPAPRTGDPFVL